MSSQQMIPTFRQTFFHGIVAGIGWAIGATIGFTILLWVLTYIFGTLEAFPFVGNLFANLEALAEQAQQIRQELPR